MSARKKPKVTIDISDRVVISILRQQLADVIESNAHTERWYAQRLEVLERLARERGSKGLLKTSEIWSCIANGTSSPTDPPTMAVLLNTAEYRAQRAESVARSLAAAVLAMFHADVDPSRAGSEFSTRRALKCFRLARGISEGSALP